MKSSLDTIFYKIVYHHIICMYDFFVNLDDYFVVVCTNFHEVVVSTRYDLLFNYFLPSTLDVYIT